MFLQINDVVLVDDNSTEVFLWLFQWTIEIPVDGDSPPVLLQIEIFHFLIFVY